MTVLLHFVCEFLVLCLYPDPVHFQLSSSVHLQPSVNMKLLSNKTIRHKQCINLFCRKHETQHRMID